MLNNRASKVGASLLALFFVLTYLLPLNSRLLWQPDETRYAEISREMLQRGDWIVPYMLDIRYFEKPVAGYWINNISQMIFGDTNFAVRFGSVFCILLSTLLVYRMAKMMWRNSHVAYVASFIYISMFLVFAVGTYSVLDPMLSLWITASMFCCLWAMKAREVKTKLAAWSALGLACGMAFMTKGFLALAIPVIVMLPITLYQKRFLEMLKYGPLAIITAVIISLPWALAIAKQEPDYWNYFFWIEHIKRFTADDAQHLEPFWYYIPIILLGAIPWTGLLPGALVKGWKERKSSPDMFFLLCWFVVPVIFFSISRGKLPTYMLPFMGPLALLMAKYGVDCVRNGTMKALKANGIINIVLGIAAVIAVIIVSSVIKKPLYEHDEWSKMVLGVVAFSIWAIIGYLCTVLNAKYWLWAASCSLAVSLCIGSALPNNTIDSKLPQNFIHQNHDLLMDSRYLMASNVGVAAGLAWETKNSNIYLYNSSGELTYGLKYPDSAHRLVKPDEFAAWLAKARQEGQVTVVFLLGKKEGLPDIPKPDEVIKNSRMAIVVYHKQ
ncbi:MULTISPECIES: lipid IV(A) 4-amino-4-deoxy-L-arabinosyltransferase [Providencia]|uniref:Undecaprenyl phosphate-alpha-4-amino-4-deoxy-L-arabinose arabinosyl transferase n=3 Tax=Providencia alcalifaciens TaxID=126385 RepID=A0AAW9VHD7_9GAMM|nr:MULTISPECIES: lipid IV(A) 4-amino-4-deoxy-L-arabinosyltransferase [Providencia]EKT66294.1 4-amino-4-deoxy-L-arabinose transferase [Providencia alcalifaciens Dmel2]ATG17730.1 lipid IV(A) 4-amino-4-deoxy-L-arabinosyltransferase [Providencia alcalifaciens]EEB45436.1 dolichyl-phosphate-mannose-protein mannosyltransferase [Providencia alcalifaciens DSM 30120]EUD03956.1 dolichyl-phosphate-mannose-protein mannosyltransferase [Providencia alcalifaciens RIMD 1656011]EUD08768.1 dolichyl-phosphate-man